MDVIFAQQEPKEIRLAHVSNRHEARRTAKRAIRDLWPESEIATASSLGELEILLNADPPDCVVFDIDPEWPEGFALCREWRARSKRIPIILLVEMSSEMAWQTAWEARVNAVRVKSDGWVDWLTDHIREVLRVARQDELRGLVSEAVHEATDAVVVAENAGKDKPMIYVNPAFLRMTGYEIAEVLGEDCRLLQGADTEEDQRERLRLAMEQGEECHVELWNYRKTGERFRVRLSISPVRDEQGRVSHYVGIQQDVTRQFEMERQLKQAGRLEAMARLAAGLAHDFNNILSIIAANTELISLSFKRDDERREPAGMIHQATQRAAALTRQLLMFGRQSSVEREPVNLNEVLEQFQPLVRSAVGRPYEIVYELEENLPKIEVNAGQLEQVILNLAVNARDAMEETGHGRITFRTETAPLPPNKIEGVPGGEYVVLEVTDTGCGMDEETLTQVFEPFFTTKLHKGTGLGLANCQEFVSNAGGGIRVRTAVGRGTTFRLYFPLLEQEAMVDALFTPRGMKASGKGERILLIEQNDSLRETLTRFLEQGGYSVEPRPDLGGLERDRYQLILINCSDPQLDEELVGLCLSEQYQEIPVLCLVDPDNGYRHPRVNRAVLVPKPFTSHQILNTVDRLLGSEPTALVTVSTDA